MVIKVVAVIGGGVIGADLALNICCFNYKVILKDLNQDLLLKAKERIKKNIKFLRLMKKDFPPGSSDELLSKINFVTDYRDFGKVDLVIENIPEVFEEKVHVYQELRDVCRNDVVFGVNSSCIPISRIAGFMLKPDNVIGIHFLNPVPLTKIVEVIKGSFTSNETLETIQSFLNSIDKTYVVVNDSPGFVTNRVLMLTINECIWVLQEGIASAKDIDKIFTMGFGHKMGPLATADLIGLDTVLNSLIVLYENFKDSKFRPCPLLKKMVDTKMLGKKTGKGFFEYQA
ncbi:3-hydroxyacyl-CoA dehydrogenase family protein [Acidobacteriota bacterium]